MTVLTTIAKAGPYAGAGTTGPFTVPFRFLDAAHLRVIRNTAGVETVLALGTDYTVSGVGATSGTVTLVAPLPVGQTLTVVRNVSATQEADYVPGDAFPAESHEQALDKLTMITQQQQEQLGRAVIFPTTDESVSELPTADQRSLRVLGFDTNGDLTTYAPASQVTRAENVSYLPAGAGAVATTVQSKLREFVSRADYDSDANYNTARNALTGRVDHRVRTEGGTADRLLSAKLGEFVSVKDFGAVGDGVADDTAAFVALRDYAASAKARVYIPSGTYILQPATDLAANDTEWHFDSGAILKLSNTQATTSFITFSSPVNQRVFGMRVDANRTAQDRVIFGEDNCAVLVVNGNKCTFDGVEIISSPAKGFALVSSPNSYTRDISVTNFSAANCGDQALLVDGNNMTGLFERIVISGVRIGATSHAGVALNDGAHSIALSDVISDVQNNAHDAVSVRDSYDIQMNNIRGRRGRSGIMFERLNGFTGRAELNNVIGEFNNQSGVLFFGAERITAGVVVGRCNGGVGINIAETGGGFRSKQINISAPSAYDDQSTPTQQYGLVVQGCDDAKIGKVIAFNNTIRNISIIRAATSNIDAEIRTTASGSTGSIAAGDQAVITLSWLSPFEDAEIDIEAVSVFVGTTGFSLAVAHVVAVTQTGVQVMVFNRNGTTAQTGTLTVIGRRKT